MAEKSKKTNTANKMDKTETEQLIALRNEIKMSVAFNENELKTILDVVNEINPVVQNNLPSIFFRTPRAMFKPKQKTYIAKKRDPVSGKMVEVSLESSKSAFTQEAILNYSITEEMDNKTEV